MTPHPPEADGSEGRNQDRGFSRRKAIGGAAVGAGALWVAPSVLGLATPAAAQSGLAFVDFGDVSHAVGSGLVAPPTGTFTFRLLLVAHRLGSTLTGAGLDTWVPVPVDNQAVTNGPLLSVFYKAGAEGAVADSQEVDSGGAATGNNRSRTAVQVAFNGATIADAGAATRASDSPITFGAFAGLTGLYLLFGATTLSNGLVFLAAPTDFDNTTPIADGNGNHPGIYVAVSDTILGTGPERQVGYTITGQASPNSGVEVVVR